MDRVGFFWTVCHGCEVFPIGEVPPWWVFRHGFHQGPRVIHITLAREPLMHHTSVMGKLVHGVRLPHEDRRRKTCNAMRRWGEDQVSNILLSTVRYHTRTKRANQNEVPWNEQTSDCPRRASNYPKSMCWDLQLSQTCHKLFPANYLGN